MPRWVSVLSQVVLGLGQVTNLVEPVLKPHTKVYVASGIALAQLLVNTIAHNSNPDGTPAQLAWEPKK